MYNQISRWHVQMTCSKDLYTVYILTNCKTKKESSDPFQKQSLMSTIFTFTVCMLKLKPLTSRVADLRAQQIFEVREVRSFQVAKINVPS